MPNSITKQELDAFEQKCQSHDWFYDYSDDGAVYRRGLASTAKLSDEAGKHPALTRILAAYNRYNFANNGDWGSARVNRAADMARIYIDYGATNALTATTG